MRYREGWRRHNHRQSVNSFRSGSYGGRPLHGRSTLTVEGWTYHVNGENELASQTLKRGAAVAPEDPRLLDHLAVVHGARGHKQEEHATLKKTLATNKPFPEMDDAKPRLAGKGVS